MVIDNTLSKCINKDVIQLKLYDLYIFAERLSIIIVFVNVTSHSLLWWTNVLFTILFWFAYFFPRSQNLPEPYKRRLFSRPRKQVKEGPDEDAVGVESTYTWSMPQFPPFHLFTPKTLSKLLTLTIPLIAIEMKRDSSANTKLLG